MMIFTVFSNKNGLPAGAWWLVTKRRYMRCSGLADVENYVFDSVLKQERRLMSCSGPAYAEKAGFRSPPGKIHSFRQSRQNLIRLLQFSLCNSTFLRGVIF